MLINDLGEPWIGEVEEAEATYNDKETLSSEFRCSCHPPHKGHTFNEDLQCERCMISYQCFVEEPKRCEKVMYKTSGRSNYQINWNSHRKIWTIRVNGKVVDSAEEGVLIKATFKHPKSGKGRARRPSIYSRQTDWYPDVGICGDYKTQLPVRYIHGLSKWYVYESNGQPDTPVFNFMSIFLTKHILEYRAVFVTKSGDIFINPMLSEAELKEHLGVPETESLF